MNFEVKTQAHRSAIENFEEMVNYFDLSLREIEKSLTNFAIIYNATDEANLNSDYLLLATFICIIKVIEPGIYQKLFHKKMDYEELLNTAGLGKLNARYWDEEESHPLRWLLKYYLSSEDVASELITSLKDKRMFRLSSNRESLANICSWLETFKRT